MYNAVRAYVPSYMPSLFSLSLAFGSLQVSFALLLRLGFVTFPPQFFRAVSLSFDFLEFSYPLPRAGTSTYLFLKRCLSLSLSSSLSLSAL
jgi:hypothetical protein